MTNLKGWAAVSMLLALGCGTAYQHYTVSSLVPEVIKPADSADVGSWFVRQVENPDDSAHRMYAYEIIYCPTDKGDSAKCRSAVVWSRDNKGGLGPQSDAPPSLVNDPAPSRSAPVERRKPTQSGDTESETEPDTTPSATASAPPPPPPPTVRSVVTSGADYESLNPDTLARVRSWMGKPVDVTMKAGGTFAGVLKSAKADGVTIDQHGKSTTIDWSEIQSVAVGRPE